jgi:hypothetical protein
MNDGIIWICIIVALILFGIDVIGRVANPKGKENFPIFIILGLVLVAIVNILIKQ